MTGLDGVACAARSKKAGTSWFGQEWNWQRTSIFLSHTKRSMASILLALSKQNMPALQTAPINLKLVAETGRLRLDP